MKNVFKRTQPTLDISRALRFTAKPAGPLIEKLETKRNAERKEAWGVAVLVFESGYRVSGVILDYSGSGARIRFRTKERTPDYGTLTAASLGIKRQFEIVWRNDFDIGCRFIPA